MNLLVSYNWMKEHVKLKATPEEFARRISLSGPSVERIMKQGEDLDRVVVGKVLKVKAHPDADKLRIAETDLGGEVKDIVCGGSNLEEGQLVAVAKPGSRVRWHGEGDPITLEVAKIRGVESFGMIAAANEIGLADMFPHEEREILVFTDIDAKPGTPVAEALELGDTIFDVEITTNRPDAFSIIGMAREASVVMEKPFTWKPEKQPGKAKEKLPLKVTLKAKELCPRYQAIVMKNVKVGESPMWLKKRLASAGLNAINNIVDITNYILLEHGQPMHAFDYEKLGGHEIVIREAAEKEKFKALDGNDYELAKGQLVIADKDNPVAVAGVMGGEESGVRSETTTIVFEAATFEPVQVRRTARALNLHSDSSTRFEKGLSTESTSPALAKAVVFAQKLAGAEVASEVFDARADRYKPLKYAFRPAMAEKLIGVAIPEKRMRKILADLGFKISGSGKKWTVEVPYWRDNDIEGERDLVEEIARVHGYDNLPSVIPSGALPLPEMNPALLWEDRAKRILKHWGFTEIMSYSFISKELVEADGINIADTLGVLNPLAEDYAYMRTSLASSMLKVIEENQGEVSEGSAFEMANVYLPREGDLPEEKLRLMLASWSRDMGGQDVRHVKGIVEAFGREFGLRDMTFEPTTEGGDWHPGRSATVMYGGMSVGTVGEVHPAKLARFRIDGRVAMADLDAAALLAAANMHKGYQSIPNFPYAKRDIAFVVGRTVEHRKLFATITGADELIRGAELFDAYEGEALGDGKKSMAYHLEFGRADRTLETKEVDEAVEKITQELKEQFDAEIRS